MLSLKIKDDWWKDGFFESDMGEALFGSGETKPAHEDVRWIIRTTGLRPPARVLDVGCGVGKHAVACALSGFDVCGIDISAPYLQSAHKLAARHGVQLRLQRMPMHELSAREEYDLVLNLFTSLGYYSPRAKNIDVLKKMVRALRPGGRIVLDVTHLEAFENRFQAKYWRELGDRKFILESRDFSQKKKQILNDRLIITKGKVRRYAFKLHLFSAREFTSLLKRQGLTHIRCYGSLRGAAFDRNGPRLVIVAQKPLP